MSPDEGQSKLLHQKALDLARLSWSWSLMEIHPVLRSIRPRIAAIQPSYGQNQAKQGLKILPPSRQRLLSFSPQRQQLLRPGLYPLEPLRSDEFDGNSRWILKAALCAGVEHRIVRVY